MRTAGALLIGGSTSAFPIEEAKDPREGDRAKHRLKHALDVQVNDKRRRDKTRREAAVAEERFYLDCVQQQLRDDRKDRVRRKNDLRKNLQSEWSRQSRVAELQKILQDAKNGRQLSSSFSMEALTIRGDSARLN